MILVWLPWLWIILQDPKELSRIPDASWRTSNSYFNLFFKFILWLSMYFDFTCNSFQQVSSFPHVLTTLPEEMERGVDIVDVDAMCVHGLPFTGYMARHDGWFRPPYSCWYFVLLDCELYYRWIWWRRTSVGVWDWTRLRTHCLQVKLYHWIGWICQVRGVEGDV